MPEVELRVARFGDYQSMAALEAAQGLTSKSFEDWSRLWRGNPCYEELGPDFPIGWVLERGDRIVGCIGSVPAYAMFRGRKLLVATGRGWAVEDEFRSYALLLMDEYFSQPDVDIFLNNTVNGKALDAFSTFGSLRVPAGDWSNAAFAITRHRGFAESALRIKEVPFPSLLSYPAGLALSLRDLLTSKSFPKTNLNVVLAHDFDERFDRFWQTLHPSNETLLYFRTREVLRWHFKLALGTDDLIVLTAETNGKIDAYAIFQRRDEPKYGLKRLRMVDFQACGQYDQYCAAFLQHASQECRARGIHVLEHVGCDLPKTRVFDQTATYRRKLPGWCYFYLTRDEELAEQLAKPEAWAPSSFDGDASL
jgi:hypothetical protein